MTDLIAEARRLAEDCESDDRVPCAGNCGCAPPCRVRTPNSCHCARIAATLRALAAENAALRGERDAASEVAEQAETNVDRLHIIADDFKRARDAALARVAVLEGALKDALYEMGYLTQQLADRGLRGAPGDTVDRVMAAARAALAAGGADAAPHTNTGDADV